MIGTQICVYMMFGFLLVAVGGVVVNLTEAKVARLSVLSNGREEPVETIYRHLILAHKTRDQVKRGEEVALRMRDMAIDQIKKEQERKRQEDRHDAQRQRKGKLTAKKRPHRSPVVWMARGKKPNTKR